MCETNEDNKYIQNWKLYWWEKNGRLWVRKEKVLYRCYIDKMRARLIKNKSIKDIEE
jgi:hypothetical protein